MVDMAKERPEELEELEEMQEATQPPAYPHGLSICLTHEELARLDMTPDLDVGDVLHMVAMARITSVSKGENNTCRMELQIIDIEMLENETLEYVEEDEAPVRRRVDPGKLYNA